MAKRMVNIPIVRGQVKIEKFFKGKLVDTKVQTNQVLNVEHWRTWQKVDRNRGRATLRTYFDYSVGRNLMDTYTATHGDDKVKYSTLFNRPITKTAEYKMFLEE